MWPVTSVFSVGLVVALSIAGCNGSGEGSTTTTTTAAPTTTLDPIAAEEAAVSEAAVQARMARFNALVNLDDPTTAESLDAYYVADGSALTEVLLGMQDLRDNGWRLRVNPNVEESLAVESVSFDDPAAPTRAELVVCIVDTGVIYEPGGGPEGEDVIVDDAVVARRSVYEMVRDHDAWKLREVVRGDSWDGITECPA
jgi:hypothetical protein